MSGLKVDGAQLYYESRGTGPLLVVVPGSRGEAGTYLPLATELQARYQVVTYDRRGFSRSELRGPQDYDRRLSADTDDLRVLIAHLTDEPAMVFGHSSGAVIALELLTGHPSLVRTVVAHDPPVVNLLPDAAEWHEFFGDVYNTYATAGIPPAMRQFTTRCFSDVDRRAIHRYVMQPATNPFLKANVSYWMEHELRQYAAAEPDIDALAAHTTNLVLASGRESRGQLMYRTTEALAGQLGLEVREVPGGHFGCVLDPAEFAAEFSGILAPSGN